MEDHQHKFLPPNKAQYIRDWIVLAPGDRVFIAKKDAPELSGHVDAVTEDGAILWLQFDAGAGRKLFTRSEGGLMWRVPGNAGY